MPKNTGSPEVSFTEKDLSFYIAGVTQGRNCIQITARRGPVNERTLIGSMIQFRETYGISIASSNSDLVCQRALDRGAVLYVNRVVHYTDPTDKTTKTSELATLVLKNANGDDTITLSASSDGTWGNGLLVAITANQADAQRFDISIKFAEQPDMNESFKALSMNESDPRYAVAFLNLNSKLVKAEDMLSGDPFIGDEVEVDGSSFIAGTDFPVTPDDVPAMAVVLADLIDALADVDATAAANVVNIVAATPGVGGNAITLSAVSVGPNITASGANLAGGANAVAATGTVTYGVPVNGNTITVGGTVFTKAAAPSPTEFSTIAELTALIDGLAAVTAVDDGSVITITAATPGVGGNAITLAKTGPALTLSGATLAGGAAAVAATGTITLAAIPVVIDNPAAVGPAPLAGGVDGLAGLDDDDWIGDSVAGNGFHAFDDVSDAMGLGSPEASSPEVTMAGIAYCENREDMIYYCEPPASVLDSADALKFRKGEAPYDHPAFNSSYGAMYFGRPKVRSPKTNNTIDISVIGDVFGVLAYSDSKAEAWFAPAGFQRGRVLNTLGVHYNVGTPARKAELDALSSSQINSIVDFPDVGTMIYDEQTLQSLPSALQSLHIRRLLIYMRKALRDVNKIWLFEPNDPVTWRRVFNLIDPYMADLLSRRAFYEYKILCDQDASSLEEAVLNTPEKVDQGIFTCRIYIKPTRTLRYFGIEAVITKSDADFTELQNIQQF